MPFSVRLIRDPKNDDWLLEWYDHDYSGEYTESGIPIVSSNRIVVRSSKTGISWLPSHLSGMAKHGFDEALQVAQTLAGHPELVTISQWPWQEGATHEGN
jgi:hypothetical protein